jgi:hypothetical protein
MLVVIAGVIACLSVLCSTIARRTQGATVLAYAVVLALVLGTFMMFAAQMVFAARSDGDQSASARNQLVLQLNPFMAMADVLDDRGDLFSSGNTFSPFSPLQSLLRQRSATDEGIAAIGFRGGPNAIAQPRPRATGLNSVPFIYFSLLAYAGLAAGSIALAARRLDLPKDTT